jgi:tRNA (guanine37-N1)-methyltransferase
MNLKKALEGKLGPGELERLPRAFDIIGDVALIEIPDELDSREKLIAETVLKVHKNIKTVCRKMGVRSGELRLRKLKVIAGKGTETVHREHGAMYRLDVMKTYFSPREATERQRVAEQVGPGETVLVMFSGIAPFGIAIARKQEKVAKVYCIELNRDACEYAEDSIRMNKLGHKVVPICGDVKEETKQFYGKCDRVIMPLPKEAHLFLPEAIRCLKKEGIIHFYHVAPEEDMFTEAVKLVKDHCRKGGRRCRILARKRVLLYSPRNWKVCIDFKVLG